jgi:membrane-associated phospholipid phosphatase
MIAAVGGGDAGSGARLRRSPATAATRAWLLAASAGCLAATTVVYLVAVRTTTGQAVENVAMDGPYEDDWWRWRPVADRVGRLASLLAVAGVVAVVAWAWRRRSWTRALAVAVSVVSAVALAEVLQLVLSRPALVAGDERLYLRPNTFPSGHSAMAVAVAVAAVTLAPPGRRLSVALAGGAYAALVAFVLMAVEAHRPADIVGAALMSTAVALAAMAVADPAALSEPGAGPGSPRRAGSGGLAVVTGVAVLASLALAIALGVVADAVVHGPLTGAEIDAARAVGFVAVGVASMAAVLGFAWLTRRIRLAA